MKIGILGGSFNPIHDGHIQIANLAIKKLDLDQVWLIPTSLNPFKGQIEVSYQDRLDLIEKEIVKYPKIKVKDYQDCSKSSYKMLKKIEVKNRKSNFFFIMGADNLESLYKWDSFNRLSKSFKIVIFSRGCGFFNLRSLKSSHLLKRYQASLIFRIKNINISSTKIRKNKQ